MSRRILYVLVVLVFSSCQQQGSNKSEMKADSNSKSWQKEKIVSLNGTLTEILVKLGLEQQIVGVDVTSTYPESISEIPKVGHTRSLQAEGILSLNPTLVLAKEGEIKPEFQKQIASAGIKIQLYDQEYSREGTEKLIAEMGEKLGRTEQANNIIFDFRKDMEAVPNLSGSPKILFIYARGAGTLMVAGADTQMHNFIQMAGAENAVTDFKDFKPLTPEALLQANPDAILLFSSGLKSLEGTEGLMQIPGISETNAGKNKNFIAMDGALISGFGPRLGKGLKQMAEALQKNKEA